MIIALFYLILTIAFVFPIVFKLNHAIPGFFSTDEPSIWFYWWFKYSQLHKIDFNFSNMIAYPFGTDLSAIRKIFPFGTIAKRILVTLSNEFYAYNIEVLSTFILAGVFMYLLMKHVTRDNLSAILSGIIFSFCPYHFARAWQHSSLAQIQWFPLLLLGFIKLLDYKILKINLLVVFSILAIFSYDIYYAYFTLIICVLFMIFVLFKKKNVRIILIKNIVMNSFYGAMLPSLFLMSFLLPAFSESKKTADAWNMMMRPLQDLSAQSARPFSYFLPASVHPIFGKFAESFIGTEWYGDSYTEHALYLGWTPLILAFVAFRRWRRNRRPQVADKENFYIGFFVFLAVMSWLFSQPPWWDIFGFKLYMPSFFMYKILPMFRAYCRFGIVVMLAVAVLAGFGLKFILERFKSQKTKLAVTALFCGLVLFEFWNWPPYKVIDLSKVPAVYYWLKDQPKDIVIADYPLDADSPNELYKFFQTVHEKKIINGTIPGTHANKVAQEIRRLSEPKTASILKWMGVKYAVVHKDDYLKTDLIEDKEDMEKIPQNRGLKFIRIFPPQECPDKDLMCAQKTGPIAVYEVMAATLVPEIKE